MLIISKKARAIVVSAGLGLASTNSFSPASAQDSSAPKIDPHFITTRTWRGNTVLSVYCGYTYENNAPIRAADMDSARKTDIDTDTTIKSFKEQTVLTADPTVSVTGSRENRVMLVTKKNITKGTCSFSDELVYTDCRVNGKIPLESAEAQGIMQQIPDMEATCAKLFADHVSKIPVSDKAIQENLKRVVAARRVRDRSYADIFLKFSPKR